MMKYVFSVFVLISAAGAAGVLGIFVYRQRTLSRLKGTVSFSVMDKVKEFSGYIRDYILKFNQQFTNNKYYSDIYTMLVRINEESGNSKELILMKQEFAAIAGAVLCYVLTADILISLCAGTVLFFIPVMDIKSKMNKRQEEILDEMPDAIDIIGANIEGGLSLSRAISRYANKSNSSFSKEIGIVMREVELGKSFSASMSDMEEKLDIKEVNGFVSAFIQADKMGGNVKDIIKAQGGEIRKKKFQRLKKKAYQAPVKLLMPLMIFIFPVIFIVLFGPVVIKLINGM